MGTNPASFAMKTKNIAPTLATIFIWAIRVLAEDSFIFCATETISKTLIGIEADDFCCCYYWGLNVKRNSPELTKCNHHNHFAR